MEPVSSPAPRHRTLPVRPSVGDAEHSPSLATAQTEESGSPWRGPAGRRRRTPHAGAPSPAPRSSRARLALRGVSPSSSLPSKGAPSSQALGGSRRRAGPSCPARPLRQRKPRKAGILRRAARLLAWRSCRRGRAARWAARAAPSAAEKRERASGEKKRKTRPPVPQTSGCSPQTPPRCCRWLGRVGAAGRAGDNGTEPAASPSRGTRGHTDPQLSGENKSRRAPLAVRTHPLPWKRRPAAFASLAEALGGKLVAGPADSHRAREGPDGALGTGTGWRGAGSCHQRPT